MFRSVNLTVSLVAQVYKRWSGLRVILGLHATGTFVVSRIRIIRLASQFGVYESYDYSI